MCVDHGQLAIAHTVLKVKVKGQGEDVGMILIEGINGQRSNNFTAKPLHMIHGLHSRFVEVFNESRLCL